VRRHLIGCAACRDAATAADSSAIFLGLGGRTLPAEFWSRFDADLQAAIAAEETRRSGRPVAWVAAWFDGLRVPRLAYVGIPAAMLLVVAGTLLLSRPGGPRLAPFRPPADGGISSPYERPTAPRPPTNAARPDLTVPGSAAWPAPGRAAEPPALEEVGSASARVYRFDGEGDDATPIYFVVDESINF
jgi:hypothetical protein